ncbi:MAG: putative Ig domain-containing protein, partial [Methanomicrobiales archaeon]|nr:putative Ig domain-containing protein [Methanomicrobiales archaeon]
MLMGLVRSYPILHPMDFWNGTGITPEITLEPLENLSATTGEILRFTVHGTDSGGKPLRYRASPLPRGAQMDEQTGVFSWKPAANQSGTYWIALAATNGRATAEEHISISIIHRNNPPVLQPVGGLTVLAGERVELVVNASDPDGDPLTYSLSTLYPGATFDNRTGVLVWQVPANLYGTGMVAVTVWDGWET